MRVVLACLTQACARGELEPEDEEANREAVRILVQDYLGGNPGRYIGLFQVAVILAQTLVTRLAREQDTTPAAILRDLGLRVVHREAQEGAGG